MKLKTVQNFAIHLLVIFLFFIISFVINKIPEGKFVAAGDFYQFIEPKQNLYRMFFAWYDSTQGGPNTIISSIPFFWLQYILNAVGFSYAQIVCWIFFLFLTGSFYGFYFSLKISEIKANLVTKIVFSWVYAVNIFTLSIFNFSWIISSHFLVYLLLPVLLAAFYRLLKYKNNKELAWFTILSVFSIISYSNIAFFLGLVLFEFLIFWLYFLGNLKFVENKSTPVIASDDTPLSGGIGSFKNILPWLKTNTSQSLELLKIGLKIAGVQAVSMFGLLSLLYTTSIGNISNLKDSKVFVGGTEAFIVETSSSTLNAFRLILNRGSFPNFAWDYYDIYAFAGIFTLLPILIVSVILLKKKNKWTSQNLFFNSYLLIFLIITFLSVRYSDNFVYLNRVFFNLTKGVFRSSEKIFTFYPYFLLTLTIAGLQFFKLKNWVLGLILVILLSPSVYFFIGAPSYFLTKQGLSNDQRRYSYSVKIPDEYYKSAEKLNKNSSSTRIISLPYSVVASTNWGNYTNWEFFGNDPLRAIYQKSTILANSFDHSSENVMSFKDFNGNKDSTSGELLGLFQKFNGEYILLHKDISPKWQDKVGHITEKVEELQARGKIDLIDSNEYFQMYQVKTEYLKPLIYASKFDLSSDLSKNIESSNLTFQKLSPVKYQVKVSLKDKQNLFFGQNLNSGWQVYAGQNSDLNNCQKLQEYPKVGKVVECVPGDNSLDLSEISYLWQKEQFQNTQKMTLDYATTWELDPDYIRQHWDKNSYQENSDGSLDANLTLYYKPQITIYLGFFVSLLTFITASGYLVWSRRKSAIK